MTKHKDDSGTFDCPLGSACETPKRKTPTLEEFKAWAKANEPLAKAVCLAQAFAQVQRERVDAYIRPIFDRYQFEYRGDLAERLKLTGPITNPDELYLCDDEERLAAYYEECDQAHRAHGFNGPHGQCPALIADHDRIKAENIFLKEGCTLFGLKDIPGVMEHRKKMLDLLLGACFVKEKAEVKS